MGSPGCVPRRPSQCDQVVMCCKPDVDAKCDWIFELVALRLWYDVCNCNPYSDAFVIVFVDIYDESISICLSWHHCYRDVDTGVISKPISITHCFAYPVSITHRVFELLFDPDALNELL